MKDYKIELVYRMQKYIIENIINNDFSLNDLYKYINYSKRQADRYFKELIGKTPKEYINHIKLSNTAEKLLNNDDTILNIALEAGYNTHEGYLKAFKTAFKILPSEYKNKSHFIPLFHYYPVKNYYNHFDNRKDNKMNENNYCFVSLIHREKRKLIFLRSQKATEYFSFCEEANCDWEGLLNSNPYKLDTAAILTLPEFLLKDGYGKIACGIEVPLKFDGKIPYGYETAELPECDMLYFQSQKYSNEEDYAKMISQVFNAIDNFDYQMHGYIPDNNIAPKFNFGAEKNIGARYAVPVIRID